VKNVKVTLAYDGSPYRGWQKNRELPTIEWELERALCQVLQHPVELHAASRTDTGVHAQGQVVRFQTAKPLDLLRRSVNGVLPWQIRVREIEETSADWHPTFDAVGKDYHYQISNSLVQLPQEKRCAWHIREPLDLAAMFEAAELLLGEHDFSAFVNEKPRYGHENCICKLECIRIVDGSPLRLELRGKRFLYKMARNLVGTLAYVGIGRLQPSDIPKLLTSGARPDAGTCAPAHGLTLHAVHY